MENEKVIVLINGRIIEVDMCDSENDDLDTQQKPALKKDKNNSSEYND